MIAKTSRAPVEILKADGDEYAARFVMSAASPDRVKDTIDPDAYKPWIGKQLIALWQHDSYQPFGVWENIQTRANKLIGDLKIAGTNLGGMIIELLAADVPLGASIGFRGKGEPNKIGGIHFTEIELLECSIVSVPAHPAAFEIAKSFGIELSEPGSGIAAPSKNLVMSDRAKNAITNARKSIARINLASRK